MTEKCKCDSTFKPDSSPSRLILYHTITFTVIFCVSK